MVNLLIEAGQSILNLESQSKMCTALGKKKKGQFKDTTKTYWSPGASDLGDYNFCALGIIQ